jgi:hypothetical protein
VNARHPTELEGLPARAERLRTEALARAAAAGHGTEALRAFSQALAGLDEAALWEAVTLGPAAAALEVSARLEAEADPLVAWRLNRARVTEDALGLPTRGSARPRIVVGTEQERELSVTGARRLLARDLGESPEPPSGRHARPAAAISLADAPTGPSGRFAAPRAPLEEAVPASARHRGPTAAGALGLRHRRVAAGLEWPTAKLVPLLVEALGRGPVEAQLSGPTASGRGVFLQARAVGRGHALQLHVPATGETAWFNAQDLLDGAALPVMGRRVCALVDLRVPERQEDA